MNALHAFVAEWALGPSTAPAQRSARADALEWQQEMTRAAAWAVPAARPSTPSAFVGAPRADPGAPPADPGAPPAHVIACAGGPHAVVRLHVQREGDAVHVWIGLDANAATPLPELVQALARCLAGVGLRLGHVVCNGHVVADFLPTPHPRRLEWPASDPSTAAVPSPPPAASSACRTSCASCSRS